MHHELYLRILIENKGDAATTKEDNELYKTNECFAAIEYITSVENKNDRCKFIRQFGNTLVRYHPEKVLNLIVSIVKEDYITKKVFVFDYHSRK